jgi:hypothetical protein
VKRLVTPAGVIHRETLALSRPDAVSLASHHRGLLQESERMTTFDATVPTAQVGIFAPAGGIVRFLGEAGALWRFLTRGVLLLMLTRGIYRFWLTTGIRRYLWSSTELAGGSFAAFECGNTQAICSGS